MHNPWTIVRQYFPINLSFCRKPTLEQRIINRIDILRLQASSADDSLSRRLNSLEQRNEQVDAFYVKTVSRALKDQNEKGFDILKNILDQKITDVNLTVSTSIRTQDVKIAQIREANDRLSVELNKTNAQLSSIIKHLRGIGGS